MKKFILLLSLFSILSANAQQQTFSRVYYNGVDNIQAYDLFRSADNHYYIAGTGFIAKTDSAGSVLWTKNYYSGIQQKFNCIIPDPDGNPVVAGTTNDGDALILKTDLNGDTLWARYIDFGNYSEAYTVSPVHDSGFVLCGYVYSATANKMFVARTDKDGNVIWSKTYSIGNHANYAYSVKETSDSGFVVAAYAENYPPFESYAVALKLDESGNSEWCKGYSDGNSSYCSGSDVIVEGNELVFGCKINNSFVLMKTDSAGNFLWAKDQMAYTDNVLNANPTRVRKTIDGKYYFLLSEEYFGGWSENMIVCDSAANQLSSNSVSMYGSSVVQASDSGFMVLGKGPLMLVKSDPKNIQESQFVIVKTDSTANGTICNDQNSASSGSVSLTAWFLSAVSQSAGTVYNQSYMIQDITLSVADECVGATGGFDESGSISFSVYPNPSNGAFSLQFENTQQNTDVAVRVYNAQGDCVYIASERMHDEILLELNGLNSGLYYIVVSTGSETMSKAVEIQR